MDRKNLKTILENLIGPQLAGVPMGPNERVLSDRLERALAGGLIDLTWSRGAIGFAMSREELAAEAIKILDARATSRPMEFPRRQRPQIDLANLGRGDVNLDDYVSQLVATA